MRPIPNALMLFAAGFGTRMGALTATQPKPLIPVGGRALIDHALALAEGADVARIVVNTHYLGGQIAAHLNGRNILISAEQGPILETGGGLRAALPLLGAGPVFTLNTDAVWTGPNVLSTLRAAWDGCRMSALLALVPAGRALGHTGAGDFALDADGRIARAPGLVYSGAQIINPVGLDDIPDRAFSLNLQWDRLIAEGRAFGVVHQGGWCDVGRPESIALAASMLERADG
ncbi:nucleotidyltransferase family protein [Phaeovulum sp.]|uniref:nucleotidyltransferase family protein n=1 Tax=Phaeovulum sp. TaxID=2934796 RepID=UPI0039E5E8B9